MNKLWLSLTICLAITSSLFAADQPTLDPHLEPLRPWFDKTFKGEGTSANSKKAYSDVSYWERALMDKPFAFCIRSMTAPMAVSAL
jgi:hypothetical protein